MKKILLFLMTICSFAIVNNVNSQCTLSLTNVSIDADLGQEIGEANDPNNPLRCKVTFNVEFDITTNSGFKYLFFHSWLVGDYDPPTFDCSGNSPNQSPPNVSRLGTTIYQSGASILDFGFIGLKDMTFPAGQEVNVTGLIAKNTANFAAYPNNDNSNGDITALNTATGAWVTRSSINPNVLHFKITGIEVEVLGPCGPIEAITDVWGTNGSVAHVGTSKSKSGAQCYLCGQPQSFNDPTLSLLQGCGDPRNFSFSITTSVPQPIEYTYNVYYHNVLDPFQDYLVHTGTITLSAQEGDLPLSTFSSGTITITFEDDPDFYNSNAVNYASIRLDVLAPDLYTNAVSTGNIELDCAPLPVNLISFTATRKNSSSVGLKWETAHEENNRGFYVERKLSNGVWQSVTFVETKATRGNSSYPLTYEFTDFNDAKGISQYRLRQLDIDGKQAFSQIRSVRGEGQKSNTIIYPNPSGDGKVNIVFEGTNSTRDVSLMDVSGKTLRQWKGVTNNNIQIDNLNAGFYTVRIVNVETGEQVVEKFIVNKR